MDVLLFHEQEFVEQIVHESCSALSERGPDKCTELGVYGAIGSPSLGDEHCVVQEEEGCGTWALKISTLHIECWLPLTESEGGPFVPSTFLVGAPRRAARAPRTLPCSHCNLEEWKGGLRQTKRLCLSQPVCNRSMTVAYTYVDNPPIVIQWQNTKCKDNLLLDNS